MKNPETAEALHSERARSLETTGQKKKKSVLALMRKHWLLYAMLVPAIVLLLVLRIYPLWGVSFAFVDYNPGLGVRGSEWVGLQWFERMFTMRTAKNIYFNTIFIAVAKIVVGQFCSLAFALLLNEVRLVLFKRTVQTMTALPHFLSWVLIGGIMISLLSGHGPVNRALDLIGMKIGFLTDSKTFPWTLIFSDVWKGLGFGAVIYLAALTRVNPELIEAAAVDGAGRFARLRHITLPALSSTIVLLSCLSLGSVLNAGFEQILVLMNPRVYATGDVIDTFVYRVGLMEANYSLGTAVGLVKSTLGFFLILLSYWLAAKFAGYRVL
jgi:putative aldouronate transport system permease protein